MKYPNAANGVKKIFTAEILALIGGVCAGLTLLMSLLVVESAENISQGNITDLSTGSYLAGGAAAVIFALAAGVLIIIAFILNVIGVNKASKDEEGSGNFKIAFIIIFVGLAASVLGTALNTTAPSISKFCSTAGQVCNLISTYFILEGISEFAKKLGNETLADKALKMIYAILCCQLLGIVIESVPNFAGAGTFAAGIAIALVLVGVALSIIAYVLYLKILSEAKKMLAES